MVEAARVEGIPPPPGGGYIAPFTVLTLILAVLMLLVLRVFVAIFVVFKPPLRVVSPDVTFNPDVTFKPALIFVATLFTFNPPFRVVRAFAESVFVATAGPLNCAVPPFTTRPAWADVKPNIDKPLAICVEPCIVTFPLATFSPLFTIAPAFRKAPPDVVRVALTDVGLFNTTCVPDIVLPPQLNVPVPDCVRLPFTLMVDAFRVEGIPPPPGGGYTAPFTEDTKKLLTATAGRVAVGWMTGTHWPYIWMDETLLVI
jgi:hypothetical protein